MRFPQKVCLNKKYTVYILVYNLMFIEQEEA